MPGMRNVTRAPDARSNQRTRRSASTRVAHTGRRRHGPGLVEQRPPASPVDAARAPVDDATQPRRVGPVPAGACAVRGSAVPPRGGGARCSTGVGHTPARRPASAPVQSPTSGMAPAARSSPRAPGRWSARARASGGAGARHAHATSPQPMIRRRGWRIRPRRAESCIRHSLGRSPFGPQSPPTTMTFTVTLQAQRAQLPGRARRGRAPLRSATASACCMAAAMAPAARAKPIAPGRCDPRRAPAEP